MALDLSRRILDAGPGGREREEKKEEEMEGEEDGAPPSELHESLGPLYYLYGTTLLYSVEESDAMMAAGAPAVGAQRRPDGGEEGEPEEGEGGEPSSEPADVEVGQEEEGEGEAEAPADPAEDLQIAWENLETARNILSRLVATFRGGEEEGSETKSGKSCGDEKADDEVSALAVNGGAPYTPDERSSLLLDLAQVHTRLGDLQRSNSAMLPCVADYAAALTLRTEVLGEYDRRVADSHFSLAAACAEAPP
ncbi:hypothetical protein THAOC_18490 [Thalassiosira oceanica]|uniref:Uncharacterized protein n=1 Tax=Thalassiosira oceanica TaxID=159749 RepID=K0S826_THAOC|nr:hypothetical protein THAOC_18490 [Thalassiosira oceanica]|eukprot:EJK61074.1 hypothetical protein THAOC_18490 [Thalassiosira oceanica]